MRFIEGIVGTLESIALQHPGVVAVSGQIFRGTFPTSQEETDEVKNANAERAESKDVDATRQPQI